ncbi:hypothetical protein Strvi_4730 [Streptomyces violaceusniger Tu 4113]|uniref:Uncharacterized protein n=1 Tax=Streptomyces violaceusniger (strain Tu 4113) TaxID=653045 RepID=G2NUC2_STRV4|nr:hypothetical protein Strvi_4730 [Streptomyces violaceusniger Tu 4113]
MALRAAVRPPANRSYDNVAAVVFPHPEGACFRWSGIGPVIAVGAPWPVVSSLMGGRGCRRMSEYWNSVRLPHAVVSTGCGRRPAASRQSWPRPSGNGRSGRWPAGGSIRCWFRMTATPPRLRTPRIRRIPMRTRCAGIIHRLGSTTNPLWSSLRLTIETIRASVVRQLLDETGGVAAVSADQGQQVLFACHLLTQHLGGGAVTGARGGDHPPISRPSVSTTTCRLPGLLQKVPAFTPGDECVSRLL